jgi:competence protein ComGC
MHGYRLNLVWCVIILLVVAVAVGIVAPNFVRMRSSGRSTGSACVSNLKNIGTALEMYSTDYRGAYAPALSSLTPNYLKTIPTCPTAGLDTYSHDYRRWVVRQSPFVHGIAREQYLVFCAGEWHRAMGLLPNYPQYSSTQGLIEGYAR